MWLHVPDVLTLDLASVFAAVGFAALPPEPPNCWPRLDIVEGAREVSANFPH